MSEITADNVREEMRAIVREAAEPYEADDSVKARIRRASVRLSLSFGRAKRLWYAEAAQVTAEEYINAQNKINNRRKQRAALLRSQLETLEKVEREYGLERAEFLAEAPAYLAWLVPPALAAQEDREGED